MKPVIPEGYVAKVYHYRFAEEDVIPVIDAFDDWQALIELEGARSEAAQAAKRRYMVMRDGIPLHPATEKPSEYGVSPTGGRTDAVLYDADGNEVAKGVAPCSIHDNFNRRIGWMIAVGRALEQLEDAEVEQLEEVLETRTEGDADE